MSSGLCAASSLMISVISEWLRYLVKILYKVLSVRAAPVIPPGLALLSSLQTWKKNEFYINF